MGGVSSFIDSLVNENNKTFTQNGALTNKSSLDGLLDFFATGAAMRMREEKDILKVFLSAFSESKLLALKTLFYFRDCREGQGERKLFRTILKYLGNNYPDLIIKNMSLIPFYGRWDDLFVLFDTKCEVEMMDYVLQQLNADVDSFEKNQNVSLLAKWMPSVNTSSNYTVSIAKKFINKLEIKEKSYRKMLSLLRGYIKVVEKQMCSNQWSIIEYSSVPSKAMLNYEHAFQKHDTERFEQYIKDVQKGKTKINSSVLYPSDIMKKIESTKDPVGRDALDAQWKSLPNWISGDKDKNILVVADTSGSMYDGVGSIYISISLALYCAERMNGPFKDYWMTFSSHPQLQKVKGNNLYEKYMLFHNVNWGYNTDLLAVFKLILTTIQKTEKQKGRKLEQNEIPTHILIISDMEFDSGSDGYTNYQEIEEMFNDACYKLPKLVWWNVASRQSNMPITKDDNGNVMVSGYSPAILKYLLGNSKNFVLLFFIFYFTKIYFFIFAFYFF